MLYSCTHMATVGVKGVKLFQAVSVFCLGFISECATYFTRRNTGNAYVITAAVHELWLNNCHLGAPASAQTEAVKTTIKADAVLARSCRVLVGV